ncbi:hypothetical protein INT45_010989, partial [Circinella minor]
MVREPIDQGIPPEQPTVTTVADMELENEDEIISADNMLPAVEVEFENSNVNYTDQNGSMTNMDIDEDSVAAPNIEQPFLFMAVFLILFRVYFRITDKATSILIRFFNMLLVAFDHTYRFPTTPDTIKNHLNFDSLTNNLTYYAVCPKCHALYNRQSPIPSSCTAEQFPHHPLQYKRACCIQVSNPATGSPILVRAALIMVACDMPAARKTCGFTSPVSRRGCYKCDRTFIVDDDTKRVNFSGGYDVENYQWKSTNDVATHAVEWMTATTNKERVEIERNYGTRWSELHRLPYFDAVRFTIIDAMHNLLLGTPKKMFNDWIDDGDLTREDLRLMKQSAEGLVLPIDFDVISSDRIAAGLSGLKAAEWKSWVLIYSPFLLQNHLTARKFKHWMKLVDACRILLKPSMTFNEVDNAHSYLVDFCKEYETIYGSTKITPNIHAHCHIRECILDYGGVYSTWLFGFERYNGILGSIATNRKGTFERTFTKRFLEQTGASDYITTFIAPH